LRLEACEVRTALAECDVKAQCLASVQHPTYKALAELGKALKTIFLCRYLHSEALRREINEGLNIVEQWNGATDFVFFAKRGEFTSDRCEDQAISAALFAPAPELHGLHQHAHDATRPCSTGMVPADDTGRFPSAPACL
jgi:hypothetical protein